MQEELDARFVRRLHQSEGYIGDGGNLRPVDVGRFSLDPVSHPVAHAAIYFCGELPDQIDCAVPIKRDTGHYTSGKCRGIQYSGHDRTIIEIMDATRTHGLHYQKSRYILGYVRPLILDDSGLFLFSIDEDRRVVAQYSDTTLEKVAEMTQRFDMLVVQLGRTVIRDGRMEEVS